MLLLELASMHSANLFLEVFRAMHKASFLALEGHAVQEWNTRE